MTSTRTTTRTSRGGSRPSRVRFALSMNHNTTHVRFGLSINHNTTRVSAAPKA